MRSLIVALTALSLTALAAPAGAVTCIGFDGLTAGTTAGVGPLMSTPGGILSLQNFQDASGTWSSAGLATIVVSNFAAGSPSQEVHLDGINLAANASPVSMAAKFHYADFGGNVNLGINGVLANVDDFSDIGVLTVFGYFQGMVGDVTVTVTRTDVMGFHFGTVKLEALAGTPISIWGAGGEDLIIDHFCW